MLKRQGNLNICCRDAILVEGIEHMLRGTEFLLRLTDLMQSTDYPSFSQGQLLQGPRAAEVCLGQA